MRAIEIARRFAALGSADEACQSYAVALGQGGMEPEEEFEAAAYILRSGGDHKLSFTCFRRLYNEKTALKEKSLEMLTGAFYQPNLRELRTHYERSCKLLANYPYLFRKDFLPFEELPVLFYPYDNKGYVPYFPKEERFGEYVNFKHPVVSRNFFGDLEKPIFASDVYSQYEMEYLNDNVRKSEYIGRENHIYLHYSDWGTFCAHLQCLNLRSLLKSEKIVFLIGDEASRYPIDFQAEYGIDYSQCALKPLGIREVHRMIWHTQLSSHNGGDFFNEIFDAHPNLLAMPSIMFENVEKSVADVRKAINQAKNFRQAGDILPEWDKRVAEDLCLLWNRTDKDILVALYLNQSRKSGAPWLDEASRIAPALFFQPHFSNIIYSLHIDAKNRTTLTSPEYEKVCKSSLFRSFKYIKTFTPMRRMTTSHGATVKFMYAACKKEREDGSHSVVPDAVSQRVLNRSFMIDWQDRLFKDSILVRFEDGKLNPKATFTALAAFLDLPYTESMTYCSEYGKQEFRTAEGNVMGFDTATVYRTYDEFVNDSERCYIEYFLRDAYAEYGYDFQWYDKGPMDISQIEELIQGFSTINGYILETWKENVYKSVMSGSGKASVEVALQDEAAGQLAEAQVKRFDENRLKNARLLTRGLYFVNRNGQPLHMMPKLELDPALLEQPLYH